MTDKTNNSIVNDVEKLIETNDIETNILFNYMKRMHRIWVIQDEDGHVKWINACKVFENCVK